MTDYHIRIIHLEDNFANARLVQIMLEEAAMFTFDLKQFEVMGEALSAFDPSNYDLILSDLNVPDSNGMETIEKWQAAAPNLPLVVSSGLEDVDMVIQAVEGGAQDYLVSGDYGDGKELALRILLAFLRKRREIRA